MKINIFNFPLKENREDLAMPGPHSHEAAGAEEWPPPLDRPHVPRAPQMATPGRLLTVAQGHCHFSPCWCSFFKKKRENYFLNPSFT